MKTLAAAALVLSLAAPEAPALKPRNRNTAAAKIGGQPSNPPELGASAEGRARAGYDVGVASATAGGRTDTGPVSDTQTRKHASERQPPSLAQPTREEILEQQRRGRIRDRDIPDWIRGPQLTELEP